MSEPTIALKEYASRRGKVLTSLKRSIGLVFAGEPGNPLHDDFRPHPHFEYLTGVTDEAGAVLLLDPTNPVEAKRATVFLRPLNPEIEQWDGLRDPIGGDLRSRLGIASISRLNMLGRFLGEAAKRTQSLACLHPLATIDQPVSPDLAMFRRIADRVPGAEIIDRSTILARMRSAKSAAEVRMIAHAVDITAVAYKALFESMRPGLNEGDGQETLEHTYRINGGSGPAYGSIVGSAINSTVLHYRANDRTIERGDLICVDSGSGYRGYGADITRTLPASGKFTKRQRAIYDIVLKALNAGIAAVKPGATFARIDAAARSIITKAGYGDAFMHGIGHHLGLETHDINPDEPLKIGAVITVEPGIYLPDEALGVRIEDNVVVTKTGCRNLSARIPRTAAAVEKAMSGRGRRS